VAQTPNQYLSVPVEIAAYSFNLVVFRMPSPRSIKRLAAIEYRHKPTHILSQKALRRQTRPLIKLMQLSWKGISLLCASLFGSFFITAWLIGPPGLPAPNGPVPQFKPDTLKTVAASSNADLLAKLSASGLREDSSVVGHIDQFTTGSDRSVHITGWAFDQYGNGAPLTISFYVDGEPRLTVNTTDRRDDVANTFNLPKNVATNIGFSGTFTCEATAQALVLAINSADGRYAKLDERRCPLSF
jgi:hypothetical protein